MPKVKRRGTTKAPSHWLTADGPRRPPSAPPDFKLNFAAIRKMSNTQSRSTLFSPRISGGTALKLISFRAFSSRWLFIKGRAKRLSPVQSSFFVVRNIRNVSNWLRKCSTIYIPDTLSWLSWSDSDRVVISAQTTVHLTAALLCWKGNIEGNCLVGPNPKENNLLATKIMVLSHIYLR